MNHRRFGLLLAIALPFCLQGCVTWQPEGGTAAVAPAAEAQVHFGDPVLNDRKILLFGPIDQRAAELTIQKLLYLDGHGHEPIDLFLQTPGGEVKYAMAIAQTMRLLRSPVNTYALSECNSGGVVLLAAGTGKRHAFHGAVIVVHGLVIGGKPPQAYAELVENSYTEFWRKRTRLPESWLPLPLNSLHILSAEQALQYGIVDDVVGQ